jgi:IS30 family transposase
MRNGGICDYRATQADQNALDRALRPKACKLALIRPLCQVVELKLRRKWSPEQIAGWLKREHPGDEWNQVSHETIYRSLFIQARGALKKELQDYLRSRRSIRRARTSTLKNDGRGGIPNAVSIRERPASVEDRAVPGHWEGDLIEGSNKSCVATLVERHSRYVMLVKLENKKTATVIHALIKQAHKLPSELYKSLTWDRGPEMSGHQRFTLETNIEVYFCDPQSPWQRGSNENTNRLLRDYLPKRTDLSIYSQTELDAIARELNERPRKTLDYETPADRFNACVATTS